MPIQMERNKGLTICPHQCQEVWGWAGVTTGK